MLLLESPPELPQPLVMGGVHWPHVDIGSRARRRSFQIHGHQLLVGEQVWFRPAGDREEAAAIPLIFSLLLLVEAAEPLLASVLL